MTSIDLSKRAFSSAHTLIVEGSLHVPNGAYLHLEDERAHLTEDETRQLRDELTEILGEDGPVPEPAPLRVGDRVVVVREWEPGDDDPDNVDGRPGRLTEISNESTYPYRVLLDGDDDEDKPGILCHSVRRLDEPTPTDDEDPELMDHIRVSAAQDAMDAADVERRHDAATRARAILSASAGPFGITGAVAPEAVITLATWLLGVSA